MSEEQTQKGWILKINLKSGSVCIYIVRATTRSSLWHLSVTLPSNFRRFADTDSAPALTLLTADMLSALCESFDFKLDRTEGRDQWEGTSDDSPIISFCSCLGMPAPPACFLQPLFTFYSGVSAVSIKISFSKHFKAGADHSFVQNIFHKEFKIFSDVEFCSLTPFFVCSCSRFSLTFQFLPKNWQILVLKSCHLWNFKHITSFTKENFFQNITRASAFSMMMSILLHLNATFWMQNLKHQ